MLRIGEQSFLRVLVIKEGVPDDRKACKRDVIKLVDERFVESLAGENRVESKPELGDHIEDVLIEGELDQV